MSDTSHADHLRRHALRATRQRVAVLKALERYPHSDAASLADVVRRDSVTISHQAVYDVLAALVEVRLVRRMDLAGAAALYEIHDDQEHGHAVCRVCGSVYDIGIDIDTGAVGHPAPGFVVEAVDVVYRGTCLTCTSAAPGSNPRPGNRIQSATTKEH